MRVYTGLDLVEVARIGQAVERWGPRFLERIFTLAERQECASRPESLAARWAAKEAAAKALGVGLAGPGAPTSAVPWTDIEVQRGPWGQPILVLHGQAKRHADAMGLLTWSLSLSHTAGVAAAVVVGLGRSPAG